MTVRPEISPEHRRRFRNDLLRWYDDERRAMPWRTTDDPYYIWLSEIMLQQTRVEQAEPYYRRFVERFPSVEDLAAADLDDVLLCWEGLGYYSRARHLHEAARLVVDEFDGELPDSEKEIRSLPGVGPYTAAAVLSIAFQKAHAVLDGNVVRVLTRVFLIETDVKRSRTRRALAGLADELLHDGRPGDFNQALMELGATVCKPRAPVCETCPLRPVCGAASKDDPEAYPVTTRRKPVPHYDISVGLIFNDDDEILIQKRPTDAMLGGLWEFPGGKRESGETLQDACVREIEEELGVQIQVGELFHRLSHAYSHFRITLHAFPGRILKGEPRSRSGQPIEWISMDRLNDYAFPRANRKLIERLESQDFGADFASDT